MSVHVGNRSGPSLPPRTPNPRVDTSDSLIQTEGDCLGQQILYSTSLATGIDNESGRSEWTSRAPVEPTVSRLLSGLLPVWMILSAATLGPAQSQESPLEAGLSATAAEVGRPMFAGPGEGLEGAISAGTYRLGPGDGITIGIWSPRPVRYDLVINLEGKLLIPSVGEMNLHGLYLDEARNIIRREILRHFHDVEVTVSLTKLRKFQVHVLGQVQNPGTYLATAVDRASAAVAWAGDLLPNATSRHITILNGDSVRTQADLFAFLQEGIPSTNPQLMDGDIIHVPYAKYRFSVRGAVNQPGAFEYMPGDRFSDAITFAGGLTHEAFGDSIEIARYVGNGERAVRFFSVAGGGLVPAEPRDGPILPEVIGRFPLRDISLESGVAHVHSDFLLQPDDIIFVRSVPEYRIKRLVEVRGEVYYPGFYAITPGETRLSEVLRRAGGITPEAFLSEATLIRREGVRLEDREFERLRNLPPSEMTRDEYEYFKLRSRENPGLMVVDFNALLAGDDSQDLLLRRGDIINVPARRDFISVLGMVRSPGNILYDASLAPLDYVNAADGYAEKADKGGARVIRAATGEWISFNDVERIEAGDTIWIPEKRERNYWQIFKEALTVTTQILTVYLIVDRALQ